MIPFQGGPMDGEDSARYQDEDGTTYHTISLTTDFEWGNYVLTDTGSAYVWHPRGGCPMPPRPVPESDLGPTHISHWAPDA